jgi:ethanolamine utilization protein EutQ (cupin superfamily)
MVQPEYGNSIAEIPGTVSELLDIESSKNIIQPLKTSEKFDNLVLVVIDAFGYNQWKRFDSGIFKRDEEEGDLHKITSVLPSMTSAALTSINTGLQPIEHTLLGWLMYYDEIDMKIQTLPFVDLEWNPLEEVLDQEVSAEILFGGESAYNEMKEQEVKTYSMLQENIAGSGFTEKILGETKTKPFLNISDMSLKLRKLLNSDTEDKRFIYVYLDEIDQICHREGPNTEEEKAQLQSISFNLRKELEKVDEKMAENTAICFTADHGQIQIRDYIDLMEFDDVSSRLKQSVGEPITPCGTKRAVFLHVKDGEVEDLKKFLDDEIYAKVMKTEEAVEEGLFGDRSMGEKFYDRAGEILVIPNGRKRVWYGEVDKKGVHGGLHEDEMYLPFSVTRLSDLQD